MSLVITLCVREGIVMAADSRMTLTFKNKNSEQQIDKLSVDFSDSLYKLFLTNKNIGISAFGRSDIKGVPISGYIESFINEELEMGNKNDNKRYGVEQIAKMICKYFRNFDEVPNTYFHIAGYEKDEKIENGKEKNVQHIWNVDIGKDSIKKLNESYMAGAYWGGETDILSRIIKQNGIIGEDGNFKAYPFYDIPWSFLNLQDAIDFAIYAIRTTADSMRFQSRKKTVGGYIDILVIKPDGANWIQRKTLHGYRL